MVNIFDTFDFLAVTLFFIKKVSTDASKKITYLDIDDLPRTMFSITYSCL